MVRTKSVLVKLMIPLLFSLNLLAQSDVSFFEQATASYKQQQFEMAHDLWRKELNREPENGSLYLNLGLAAIQQEQWGLALGYLRQGQKFSPRLFEFQDAIRYIQAYRKSGEFLEPDLLTQSFETQIGKYFLFFELLSIHWILSLATLLVLVRFLQSRDRALIQSTPRPTLRSSQWILMGVWVLLTVCVTLKGLYDWETRGTVLPKGNTPIRSGPMVEAPELAHVPEGALVSVGQAHNGWVHIRFGRNPAGWIPAESLWIHNDEGTALRVTQN